MAESENRLLACCHLLNHPGSPLDTLTVLLVCPPAGITLRNVSRFELDIPGLVKWMDPASESNPIADSVPSVVVTFMKRPALMTAVFLTLRSTSPDGSTFSEASSRFRIGWNVHVGVVCVCAGVKAARSAKKAYA